MKNQNLIIKLKSLNSVEPDAKFLKDNRELLLSQIENSGVEKISSFDRILLTSENLARLFSRPAFALGVFVVVLFGANFIASSVLAKSKPNESLYIARVISERVKVNTTINQEAREKLAINYALRHAEDIASILSDEKFNNEENSDQVAKLSDDFIKEVNKVEDGLNRLSLKSQKANVNVETAVNLVVDNDDDNEATMTIADNSKDDDGLEIYIPEDKGAVMGKINIDIDIDVEGGDDEINAITLEEEVVATSSETKASSSEEVEGGVEADLIIQSSATSKTTEAKELAEKKDFGAALNKLNEAVESIKN